MDCESNIDSIRTLDEQIKEQENVLTKLKRARNSLLSVSKLPPEVLGCIFSWNVTRKGDFGGLEERSHNFLLVCHHWSEVASQTQDLWGFWGNDLQDWSRWCRRFGTAPLDLILGGDGDDDIVCFGDPYEVLEDRAASDTIRRVHLGASDATAYQIHA